MSVQRWTYDADVGLYCRMDDGNYMLLPHGTVVVLAADHERIVAEKDVAWATKHSRTIVEMKQAHAAALAEVDALRFELREAKRWLQTAREVTATRTLTADDPEPAVESVVLDGKGKAWARTREKNGEWWWVTYDEMGLRWDSLLRLLGPVRLIHDGEATRTHSSDAELDAAWRAKKEGKATT